MRRSSRFDNIAKNYVYTFLATFNFSEAIWVLYLAHRGMSLVQIGLLEAIFHFTSMIMEIPTGIVADRFGRKTSRVLSRAMAFLSSILMILSHRFWGFAIAFVLTALSYNLESGAGDALVYDSLIDADHEKDYMKVKGRTEIAYQSARGLALVIGGFLATFSYELAYGLSVVIHGLSLSAALTFREPSAGRVTHDGAPRGFSCLVLHCRNAIRVIRGNGGIFLYILFIETFSLFYTTLYFYFQTFLKSIGHRESSIGLVLALSATASVIAATQAHRIEARLGRVVIIRWTPFIAILAMGLIAFSPFERTAMVLFASVVGLLYVTFSDYINRMIPSESRATLLSFEAMVFSLMMILFFPLMGWLSEHQGFKTTFQAIFLASILVLLGAQRLLLRSSAVPAAGS